MKGIKTWLKNWRESSRLISIFTLKRPPAQPSTAHLYILRVDFPLKQDLRTGLEQALDPIKQKYGIDFLVLEPGIKLSRFDDI